MAIGYCRMADAGRAKIMVAASYFPTVKTRLVSRPLTVVWIIALSCLPISALSADRQVSQYAHTAWRMQDGAFNGTPFVITQTADGYLWIGTNLGLVYFDGVRFRPLRPPPGERLLDSRIFSLVGTRDGSLWIGSGYSISRWRNGHLLNFPQVSGRIEALTEDDEGSVWLARTQATDSKGPVCRIKNDQARCYGVADGIPFPNALQLAHAASGEIWVVGYSEILRWKPGSSTVYFPNTTRRPEGFPLFRTIASGANGSLWTALDRPPTTVHLESFADGRWTTHKFPQIPGDNSEVTSAFVDHGQGLWIGTARHGVYRVRGDQVEHLSSADGLSSNSVVRFFEDTEGTLWIVTSAGLDNLRDVRVATYSSRQGLDLAGAVEVMASRDGSLWINDNFQSLDVLRNGKLISMRANHGLPGKHVTTFHEDVQGRLWVGIDNDLWVYSGGSFRKVRRSNGSSLGIVFSIAEGADHDMWVRAGPNLDRIHDFSVSQELTSPQISSAYILAAPIDGGVIIGRVNGDLVMFHNGDTQTVASGETGNTSQIRDLLVQPDGSVYGATLDELFRLKDGVRKNLTIRNGLPCDGIFSLVEDGSRAIWLYTQCGLIKIERSELDRWWGHPNEIVKVDLLDAFDGAEPGLTSLKPQSTLTPDGRLWFANVHVLQMLDPRRLTGNTKPPPVHIQEVVADRKTYTVREGLRLPPRTRDLEINYTALSFVAPQKVRFRYKLEGHDSDWREPGTRRQAVYNDLGPGQYHFRVLACNNDGIWNETGASLGFIIAPAYYETTWFKLFIFGVVAGLLWLAYLSRLRYATARIHERLAARLEERERIARELHDTLLQGFHGLMLRFQAVLKHIPSHDPAHQMLEKALVRGDEVLLEGRQHVQGIREEGANGNDLPEKLALCGQELAYIDDAQFRLTVLGTPQAINPAVCNEAYQIGREAMVNAFRHAHAANIEADITYDHSHVHLTIRDDGAGIDQAILNGGRAGHWGLSGMRERAKKIGSEIRIWSRVGAGTEIELIIPGTIAYCRADGANVRKKAKNLASDEEEAAKL